MKFVGFSVLGWLAVPIIALVIVIVAGTTACVLLHKKSAQAPATVSATQPTVIYSTAISAATPSAASICMNQPGE